MSDLIERQAAIDCFNGNIKMTIRAYFNGDLSALRDYTNKVINKIKRLPQVNVAEKAGEWLDHQNGIWIYAKCSKCESVHDVKSKYCPTCGAKMKMEGDDDLS